MWRRTSFIFVEPDSRKVLAYKQTYNGCRHSVGEGIYISRFRLLPTFSPSFPHQTPRMHVAEDFLHLRRA